MWGSRKKVFEIKINSGDDPKPVCPHCEKELASVLRHRGNLNLIRHLDLFCCPHCHKVLGTAATFK